MADNASEITLVHKEPLLKHLALSVRPKEWYKNGLVFIGIIFSNNILHLSMLEKILYAFICFCLISGGVYLINDIFDRNRDKEHPIKSKRPIASGRLKVALALPIAIIMIAISMFLSYLNINTGFLFCCLAYVVLTSMYSTVLKHAVIIDVLAISAGFVLRAVAGCVAINIFISPWLITCTFLLAMLLALGKRYHEIVALNEGAGIHRAVLNEYSVGILKQLISIVAGATIISYLLYSILDGSYAMLFTIPCVIYGILRYIFIVNDKQLKDETGNHIFSDRALLFDIGIWVLIIIMITFYHLLA